MCLKFCMVDNMDEFVNMEQLDNLCDEVKGKLVQLWGKVGFIINLSQMIEYNLTNILAMDEILREFEDRDSMTILEFNGSAEQSNHWEHFLETKPLGTIIKRAKEVKFFTDESVKTLETVLERRNEVAHHIFKKDLIEKHLENDPSYYFPYLEETIQLFYTVNESLSKIYLEQKKEYKMIY